MIRLTPLEHDDHEFLALVERIINGAIIELRADEAFVVHVDNWFDQKWLGWRSWPARTLRIPIFTPNRICSEKHFVRDQDGVAWTEVALQRPLHVKQPGRPWLARRIDRLAKRGAFVWYSGNTAANGIGSLMLYLSNAEGYCW